MIDQPWCLALGACGTSLLLTLLLRKWLLAREYLDLPNHRSSHSVPVPRGGGVAFVAIVCAGLAAMSVGGNTLPSTTTAALSIFGVAAIGFCDDLRGVSARMRLAIHVTCAAVAMWAPAAAIAQSIPCDPLVHGLLFGSMTLAGAWFVNMFNFMDGIDGMAAMEGTFVLVAAGAISLMADSAAPASATLPWAMVSGGAAVAGFLVVNVSPWRIFMGDAGSGALGMLVAWALAASATKGLLSPWAAIALPATFTADACSTLAMRVLRGESPAQAHRTHAYQRLVRRGGSHARTTAIYATVNVVVVLPVAWGIQRGAVPGPAVTIVLHGLLVAAAIALGAGREPRQVTTPHPGR
jgi:Fuc2NAc and GlcNAc transferase